MFSIETLVSTIVGLYGYVKHRCGRRIKDRKLIFYLRKEKEKGTDKGQRSIVHLSSRVGLTEDEIFQASCRNRKIRRTIKKGKDDFAAQVLYEYHD